MGCPVLQPRAPESNCPKNNGGKAEQLRAPGRSFAYGGESLIALHCRSLYLTRIGAIDEAEDLALPLLLGPDAVRARARLTLGGIEFKRGEIGAAITHYRKAIECATDPLTLAHALKMQAVSESLSGKHHSALHLLECAYRLTESIPAEHPLRLDLLNSIACELIEIDRVDQARVLVARTTASPIVVRYPEWLATARDERPLPARPAVQPRCFNCRVIEFDPQSRRRAARGHLQMEVRRSVLDASTEALETMLAVSQSGPDRVRLHSRLTEATPLVQAVVRRAFDEDPETLRILLRMWKNVAGNRNYVTGANKEVI